MSITSVLMTHLPSVSLPSLSLAATSAGCRRCEQLPPPLQGPGTIYLKFPLAHSRSKILSYLSASGLQLEQQNDILSIDAPNADLASLLSPLREVLSSIEQADVRVLFQPKGCELQLADCFEVESLNGFLARSQSRWLLDLMSQNRLTSWFQPLVSCEKPSHVFAYECLMRGLEADGETVFPAQILEVARGAGLLFQLDRAARLAAIRCAAQHQLSTRIFINFIPTAIYDPINCLKSTVKAVDEAGIARERIVFEVIESELVHDVSHLKNILDYYRGNGFSVALDDVGAGYSNLNLLAQLRPDYIKLDMQMTRGVDADPYKATVARKLLETAREIGVTTIAEGIETHEELQWLCEHGADYVQGYFFAKPAPIPPLL